MKGSTIYNSTSKEFIAFGTAKSTEKQKDLQASKDLVKMDL